MFWSLAMSNSDEILNPPFGSYLWFKRVEERHQAEALDLALQRQAEIKPSPASPMPSNDPPVGSLAWHEAVESRADNLASILSDLHKAKKAEDQTAGGLQYRSRAQAVQPGVVRLGGSPGLDPGHEGTGPGESQRLTTGPLMPALAAGWRRPMASQLDQMNPTELLASSALLLARAEALPKGDPKKARLLLAAKELADRSSQSRDGSAPQPSSRDPRGA
jgi:hypothetical protein